MGPAFLILAGVALVVGLPLLAGAVWIGSWMRRSNHAGALKTFVGLAIALGFSFLSMLGAVALLIAIAAKEHRHPDYFGDHPALPLLMIALFLLAVASAALGALLGVWTLWRMLQAPAAQPLRTTPAA